ncbi:MAG: TonB-dependent receptor, partial [candidate division Zixibacteria bacterium]|nr:TonB-dependent receptor [candidate division Zixibacteria bacterium]
MKTTSAVASTWLIPGLVIICLIAGVASVNSESAPRNKIVGRVTDVDSEEALPGANVAILDTYGGTVTDNQGAFALKNLKDGAYRLQVSHVGYENKIVDSLRLSGGQTLELNIELKKEPVSIKGVIVTPGQYSIMGGEPTPKQILSREIIESRPQLSEDLFRAVQRLPGIAYNDFSAKFNIRGGEQDEVLINLDGMEIYEPFHLKDVDGGVISITDVAAVAGVDLMAGGYPANYGDRMSGVFNITSKTPSSDYNRVSVGLSLMNARFLSEGTFADKRGSWLVSGRRGYLDLVLGLVGQDDEVRPKYYDVFTKLRYKLSSSQTLTASFLRADDDLRYLGEQTDDENNQGDTLLSSYGNTYFWLTL